MLWSECGKNAGHRPMFRVNSGVVAANERGCLALSCSLATWASISLPRVWRPGGRAVRYFGLSFYAASGAAADPVACGGRTRCLGSSYENIAASIATFVTLAATQLAIRPMAGRWAFKSGSSEIGGSSAFRFPGLAHSDVSGECVLTCEHNGARFTWAQRVMISIIFRQK